MNNISGMWVTFFSDTPTKVLSIEFLLKNKIASQVHEYKAKFIILISDRHTLRALNKLHAKK